MPKLIIKQKGKLLQKIELTEGKEYLIGRGKESDIILPEEPGISRKHLSFSEGEDNQWIVKNLSQISTLNINGVPADEGSLSLGGAFQVQDFEFLLQSAEVTKPPLSQTKTKDSLQDHNNKESPSSASLGEESAEEELAPSHELPAVVSSEGETHIMDIGSEKQKLSAYLKVSYADDAPRDIFKLEEQEEWIFGRDETADIMVDNPNISREHFKISESEGKYYIKDLKSSNGTLLNDKELSTGKKYPIQSGDVIYILDIEIVFEIKNLSLEKELSKLTPPSKAKFPASGVPVVGASGVPVVGASGGVPVAGASGVPVAGVLGSYMPPPLPAHVPGVILETSSEDTKSFFQKNKKRLMIYGALAIAVVFIFSNTNKESVEKGKEPTVPSIVQTGEGAGLTPQQLQIVKDTYQSAQQLYSQGKFEYCKSEVIKIHEYTDSYRDSKKLEIACAQAAENQRMQYDLERKKRKAEETEKLIQKTTDKCREKFDTFTFKHELVTCLNPAIELSPADSRIHILTEKFDAIEIEKEEKKQQIAERKQFIRSIANKYTYARSLYKSGKILKAMTAYRHFISSSNHRELKETRDKAQRELATIQKNFHDKNNKMHKECSSQFNANQFKIAYYTCRKAYRKIPPPHNAPSLKFMQKAKQTLEVEMKPIYEEANLNESVGNVSIAQEHWKKILKRDVDTGLYYNRAKEKMDKY